MSTIAILGAGLAGLALAWELNQLGLDVTVYERAAHPGGVIRSEVRDGFVIEHGAQLAADRGELSDLAKRLGVELLEAEQAAKRRYVVRDGALAALDGDPLSIARSKVLSARGKLRVMAEPMIPRRDPALGPESVADFVRRRLGDEVLSWGVEPFVGGTLLGDVERLDVAHSMPALARMERDHGSLIRAGMSGPRGPLMRMVTARGGMQRLTDALAARLGSRLITRAQIMGVEQDAQGFIVRWTDGDWIERAQRHAAVCAALPGHALAPARWPEQAREALIACQRVAYSPVTVVALGFRREQVAHPLDGLGVLVPAVEGRRILAALFSSTVTPAHAPPGHVLITAMLGGARQPAMAALDVEAAIQVAREELEALVGARGEPCMTACSKRMWALPQPELGFSQTLDLIRDAEQRCPGLYLGGSLRDGAGIPATLSHAHQRAQHIAAQLA